jgi:hypothetical protein
MSLEHSYERRLHLLDYDWRWCNYTGLWPAFNGGCGRILERPVKFVYTDPAPIMPHPAACLCDDCMEILTRPDIDEPNRPTTENPCGLKLPVTPGKPEEVPAERATERSLSAQKGEAGATPWATSDAVATAWDKESLYVPRSHDRQILREKLKSAGKNHAYDWWDGTSYQPHARYTTLVNCQGDTLSVPVVCPPECTGGVVLESEIAVESGKVDELLKLYNIPSQLADAEEGWDANNASQNALWEGEGGR